MTRTRSALTVAFVGMLLQSAVAFAQRERINIDNDWRFTKGDPEGTKPQSLVYQINAPVVRGQPSTPGTPVLAPWILPTANAFIADAAKRHARPEGNFGENISFVTAGFDDTGWRALNLPHDFAIEGPFIGPGEPGTDGPTGRLPFFGVAWYRKHLDIPAGDAGKQIYLDIDGAMSYSTVWLNGQLVGGWPYGYASYRLDLTPYAKPGGANVLAIRLDNPPNSSRWYPGGGIYRHVWLTKTAPVHVGQWGTYITTPQVAADAASVNVKINLDNDSKQDVTVAVATEIWPADRDGHAVIMKTSVPPMIEVANVQIPAGKSASSEATIKMTSPKLWSPTSPNRYVALTRVTQNGNVVDTYETPFGIRTVKYDPNQGFFVNGEHFKLNGVCDHHDLGALGSALNVRALQRQLEMLHDMGCNAIRTSHNPPAPELLDFADAMGFMVFDESFDTWTTNKRPNDYGGNNLFNVWHEPDLRAEIRRDRNHPSIIMWSVGNEIDEQNQGGNSAIARELVSIVHQEDPTRPTSAACNNPQAMNNGFSTLLDIMGFNYKPDNYVPFHQRFPNQPFFATETASTISTRGEYYFPVVKTDFGAVNGRGGRGGGGAAPAFTATDAAAQQVSSYDLYYPSWATSPDHEFYGQDHSPAVAGEFVWTGFDYIGEPDPFAGANQRGRSSYYGIIDLAGFPKDRYYIYQAHWRPELPMAHILPHWNWPDRVGQVTPVHVYTSGDEAELFLNGKSLGRKKKVFEAANANPNGLPKAGEPAYRIRWDDVVYEPGELKVVAYKNGKEWATETVKTTGAATQLLLKPDRAIITADGHDLSFVTLTVADAEGRMVPRTKNLITFEISGPGEIVATDNGDPTDLNVFSKPERHAFNGLALAIVRTKVGQAGAITLTAKSEGLTTATTTITGK